MTDTDRTYDVWASACWQMLELVRSNNVELEGLFDGLSFDAASIRGLLRVSWDDYALLCDRVVERVGDLDRLDQLVAQNFPRITSDFGEPGQESVSLVAALRVLTELVGPAACTAVAQSTELLSSGVRISMRLRPSARASAAFFFINIGVFKALTTQFHLPSTSVRAEVHSSSGIYDIALPHASTLRSSLAGDGEELIIRLPIGASQRGRTQFVTFGSSADHDAGSSVLRAISRWSLTPRQGQVLSRVVKGASNKDIARTEACAENTIELHMTNIMRKARVSSRAELIALFWSGEDGYPHATSNERPSLPRAIHELHRVA